jgi:hypothetical protein
VAAATIGALSSEDARTLTPAQKLRIALDLAGLAERMMLQKLRLQHPDATESELHGRLEAWMRTRPGAEHGDGVGRPIAWPRRRT